MNQEIQPLFEVDAMKVAVGSTPDLEVAALGPSVGNKHRRIIRDPTDNSSNANQSKLRPFEGSLKLETAHSLHAAIRSVGQGRFSHWSFTTGAGGALRCAASDNPDPRTNGRNSPIALP